MPKTQITKLITLKSHIWNANEQVNKIPLTIWSFFFLSLCLFSYSTRFISHFLHIPFYFRFGCRTITHQNFKEKDAGKVVLYSTSMGIVRETYAKCANVKQILRTLLVKFEERDIFMSCDYQKEIKDRMQSLEIQVPQLFVDGQHIGVSITDSHSGHFSIYSCEIQRHAVKVVAWFGMNGLIDKRQFNHPREIWLGVENS